MGDNKEPKWAANGASGLSQADKRHIDELITEVSSEMGFVVSKDKIDEIIQKNPGKLKSILLKYEIGAQNKLIQGTDLPEEARAEKVSWLKRAWHLNPFSPFGEIYRRAKKNDKRFKEGKLQEWQEKFVVGGKLYDLKDPAALNALPDGEKIYLGNEMHKRRLRDILMIGIAIAGFIPEATGFGLWIHDKYFKKVENPPAPWDYIWSKPPRPKTIEQGQRPSQPAPVWTEAGCMERNLCPQPVYSADECSQRFPPPPPPKCEPKIKTEYKYKDECLPEPICPAQEPCLCTDRDKKFKR